MNNDRIEGGNAVQMDVMLVAGAGLILSSLLYGLFVSFHYWFAQCVLQPTHWNLLVGLKG